jgi:hypothetical protein
MFDGTEIVSASLVRACAAPPARRAPRSAQPARPVRNRRIANLLVSHSEPYANWRFLKKPSLPRLHRQGGAQPRRPKPKEMRGGRITAAVVLAAGALVVSPVVRAAQPPDPHDPCVRAGRDTCGTAGVGSYRTYRYGLRWFGDYRGALATKLPTFCLDLGYWYAARSYGYRAAAGPLRNRDGAAVSSEDRRRLAYAVWRYGRSSRPLQQGAVMLYVHSLMGDAQPGEIDPSALGAKGAALYARIARDSARLHGPYRIDVALPKRLLVGERAAATVRVLAASGDAVPSVSLAVATAGADGAPKTVRTGASGTARLELTPTAVSGLRLRLSAPELAAPEPHVYGPTRGAARANGQRLVVPAAAPVVATVKRDVGARPNLVTRASAQSAAPGAKVHDNVTITGLGGASAEVHVELWGPFPTRAAIACTGTPYWTGSFTAGGDGTTATTPVPLDRVGYYSFRESIAPSPPSEGFETLCAVTVETTLVEARPTVTSLDTEQIVRPGSPGVDRVSVAGLGKTPAKLAVELFGPFGSRAAVSCTYSHLRWHGEVPIAGDVQAARVAGAHLDRVGFYTYRARVVGAPLVAGTSSSCTSAARTLLVAPRIVTGRGDVAKTVRAPDAAGAAPDRLRIASVGIDAPIEPSGIDLVHGVLGIPADIQRLGWWRDGSAPGASTGATLIAGHVDSAASGEGALFALAEARRGDLAEVTTAAGRTLTYRVDSVRSYPKADLPESVYSRRGPARLVVVTCGGAFDESTGHYPDDVVLSARPGT